MMMQGLRKAGQTWLGKLVVGVMFSLLIISFAFWGIADIFRGYGRSTAATVGGTEIGVEQLRVTYQNELRRITRQTRGQITPETARAYGLDQAVLARMVRDAALDERVRQLGLAISDETIASTIMADPSFRGPDGKFDRRLFDAAISDSNYNEATFIATQRKIYLRQHLEEGVAGAVNPPVAIKEAMHRLANEARSVEYLVLPADKITATDPDDAALQKFFDERKTAFRAPEYRALNIVTLSAGAIAKPEAIAENDARKLYEEVKTSRFGSPERRAIRQMRFPTMEEAKAASDKIKAGATFESIAAERNITDKDLDLGRLTKREVVDAAVGEAAFALAKDAVSEPVNGQFGPAIVKIVDIEAENVRPFAEVVDELKRDLATTKAQDQIRETHDKIEDQRASAKPLSEIAPALGLIMRVVDGVDREGLGRDGKQIANLPERESLLRAAFASDIGADNEPIAMRDNGYVWFEVTKVDPARERTLAEVRDEAVQRFKDDDVARQLTDRAAALVKRAEGGETLAAISVAEGLDGAKSATGLRRDAPSGDISRSAAVQVFAAPVGRILTATAANGRDRLVIRITDASAPPFITTTQGAIQIDDRLRAQLAQDLIQTYIAKVQSDLGVRIYPEAVKLALGGDSPTQ